MKDQQYLLDNGWRLITSQSHQYGKIYYWDHNDHQREDGRWWTQGDAVKLQRKHGGCKKRSSVTPKHAREIPKTRQ